MLNSVNNIYANQTARFDGSARAMTDDELRAVAPSIFATTAHESRSDRFRPIPTIEVLNALRREGFEPVGATQMKTRDPSKRAFSKHLIRLRRLDDDKVYRVGDNVFEILLKNANDGTAAYDLISGLWRIRCLNSLVAASELHDSLKVYHSGDVTRKVIDGTFRVLDNAQKALEAPDKWSRVQLDNEERKLLAETAHELRFGDEPETVITADALIRPRRREDADRDLWTTFNVIQENTVRGGLSAREIVTDAETGRSRTRLRTTRAVKAIDNGLRLNSALWKMAEKFAELKGVKLSGSATESEAA